MITNEQQNVQVISAFLVEPSEKKLLPLNGPHFPLNLSCLNPIAMIYQPGCLLNAR